jgi:hypothetical protein
MSIRSQCSFNGEYTMQTLFHEGDISSGTCHVCRKPVTTRFETRSIRLKRSSVTFPNILVSVCTICSTPVDVPKQSYAQFLELGAWK